MIHFDFTRFTLIRMKFYRFDSICRKKFSHNSNFYPQIKDAEGIKVDNKRKTIGLKKKFIINSCSMSGIMYYNSERITNFAHVAEYISFLRK